MLSDPLKTGKFVVIHNQSVKYIADSFQSALKFALENFSPDEFIVQQNIDETNFINYLSRAV